MPHLELQNIGQIEFDAENVPRTFSGSESCNSAEEFCRRNFLPLDACGHALLVCSRMNAAALGDYLCAYARADCLGEICSFLSGEENYWQGVSAEPAYSTLGWELQAIRVAFGQNLQSAEDETGEKWFVIKDAKPDAVSHITPERHAAVARFCEDQLLAFFEDRFECGGDWDSVFDESNAGPWLTSIYMKFCSMHV